MLNTRRFRKKTTLFAFSESLDQIQVKLNGRRAASDKGTCRYIFRIFEKRNQVVVVAKRVTEQRNEIRKTPLALHLGLDQFYQQVRDHHDPYLDLDRVGAFAVKEVQGKVLLQLFVERFDLPPAPVNFDDFSILEIEVIR